MSLPKAKDSLGSLWSQHKSVKNCSCKYLKSASSHHLRQQLVGATLGIGEKEQQVPAQVRKIHQYPYQIQSVDTSVGCLLPRLGAPKTGPDAVLGEARRAGPRPATPRLAAPSTASPRGAAPIRRPPAPGNRSCPPPLPNNRPSRGRGGEGWRPLGRRARADALCRCSASGRHTR